MWLSQAAIGYNSYSDVWVPLREIKEIEDDRGNGWFDDSGLDLDKTLAIWVTEDPRSAVLYHLTGDFRETVDQYYNTLPRDPPDTYGLDAETYAWEREQFLDAENAVAEVDVSGAQAVLTHDEPFGSSYLFIKPIKMGGKNV